MQSKVDNKNLHNNASGQPFPEPDVPVEDAWNSMKQLLQHAPTAPGTRPGFSFGKGVTRFWAGTGLVAIISVITYVVAIKKEKPASQQVHYTSDTTARANKVKDTATAYHATPRSKTVSHEFSNTPFKEAAAFLENAYGVTIIVKNDAIYNCTITTRFDNKSLEEILDILGYTLAFEYKIDQTSNQVIISGDGCN